MDFSRYTAWVFDFDYTLCDATPGIVKSYNETFRNFGYQEQPENVIRETVGLTVTESFMKMTGSDDAELALKFYHGFISVADKVMTGNTVYLPGSRELLHLLKANGNRCAVVTTKLSRRITDFFTKRGESDLIDFVIGFDEVKKQKPAPDGLLAACKIFEREHGTDISQVVYVGDNEVDARAAMAAGIDFIAVTSGTTSAKTFASYPNAAILSGTIELLQKL